MMDTYSMHKGYSVPGVVTGKPISVGGSLGRSEATGRGCVFAIMNVARRVGIDLEGATVAVQGFGNAGSVVARLLAQLGESSHRGERFKGRCLSWTGAGYRGPSDLQAGNRLGQPFLYG